MVWINKFLDGETPNHLEHFGFLSFSPEIEEAKWETRRGNSPNFDSEVAVAWESEGNVET